MASIPTFDYLTIAKIGGEYIAKYIVKANDINYSTNISGSISGAKLFETLDTYFKTSLSKEERVLVSLIQIYPESITVRFKAMNGIRNIKLPIRNNIRQVIKAPFLTFGASFQENVFNLITEIDASARPEVKP